MTTAVFSNASLLRKFIDAFSDVSTEADLTFGPDGIDVAATDRPGVVFARGRIHKRFMHAYEFETPVTVGVNLKRLVGLLSCADRDGEVTLQPSEKEVSVALDAPDGRSMCLNTPAYEPTMGSVTAIPDFTGLRARLIAPEFARNVKDMQGFADVARFTGTGKTLCVEALGYAGTARVTYIAKKECRIECAERTSTVLTLRFLAYAGRAAALSKYARVAFNQDSPALIEFEVEKFGRVQFFIAPQCVES